MEKPTKINFAFVYTKELTLEEDDGSIKTYQVLVLDDKLNTEYWKIIASFSDTITRAGITTPEEAKCWEISLDTLNHFAISDIIADNSMMSNVPVIHEIPISLVEDKVKVCRLVLNNGKVFDNLVITNA